MTVDATSLSPLGAAQQLAPALAPPGLFVRGDEAVRVTSFCSTTGVELRVEGRVLVPGRGVIPFSERHAPNSDRTIAQSIFRLAEGWLLECNVRASAGAPRVGQCFAIVELVRGDSTTNATPTGVLIQGYVTDTQRPGFPIGHGPASTDGLGALRVIVGTDVGAGGEISETLPANGRYKLLSFRFSFVTDATVANRTPAIFIDDGAQTFFTMPAAGVQAASLGVTYLVAPLGFTAAIAGQQCLTLPVDGLTLYGGWRIRTSTTNLQAGDNYSAPTYLLQEWIED